MTEPLVADFDWRETLMTQYANSPTICELIERFHGATVLATQRAAEQFYSMIWNIDTAVGYGLDVWGKIIGVSRQLQVSGNVAYLGFKEQYAESTQKIGPQPFNVAPMRPSTTDNGVYKLDDDAYRLLILSKAMSNITDCSIPSINRLLSYLFKDRGRAYVVDYFDRSIGLHFDFQLTAIDLAILSNTDVMPRPAGVSMSLE